MVKGRKILIAATAVFLIAAMIFCVFIGSEYKKETETSLNFSDTSYSNGKGIDKGKVLLVDITISAKEFDDMLNNAHKKEVHQASVKLNGIDIGKIGIRIRGNSSLDMGMALGGRYSFELRLDEYSPSSFNGMSRINLNLGGFPQFLFQEYMAYQLFDTMDVPSPQAGFAFITINGQDWGVYLAVEETDKNFLSRHFETSDGNLYKASETKSFFTDVNGKEFEMNFNHIQNKNDTENAEIAALYEEIQNTGDIRKFINNEQFIKYAACDFATGNTDGFIGSGGGANFCLYEQDGIFSIIPWDYDKALFSCFRSENHSLFGISEENIINTGNSPSFISQLFKYEDSRNLYKKYVIEICEKFYEKEYENLLKNAVRITDDYFKRDKTIVGYDEWRNTVFEAESMADGNMLLLGEEMNKQLREIVNGDSDCFYFPNGEKSFAFENAMSENDEDSSPLPIEEIKENIRKSADSYNSPMAIIISSAIIILAIAVAVLYGKKVRP